MLYNFFFFLWTAVSFGRLLQSILMTVLELPSQCFKISYIIFIYIFFLSYGGLEPHAVDWFVWNHRQNVLKCPGHLPSLIFAQKLSFNPRKGAISLLFFAILASFSSFFKPIRLVSKFLKIDKVLVVYSQIYLFYKVYDEPLQIPVILWVYVFYLCLGLILELALQFCVEFQAWENIWSYLR